DIAVGVLVAVALAFIVVAAVRLDGVGFWAGLGLLYVGLPALSIAWMRTLAEPRGAIVVLWFFLVIWATDIAAYFAGRAIGGPKLAPAISPKKTWSGAIAGLLGAALASIAVAHAFALPSALALVAVGVLVSALGQLGDLMESLLKRVFGQKDSGHLIPGHGGVLDRIDSYILTAPAVAFALALPGAGAI
ncbi:MAG: phosphatidate cytidylyltransferase, partial [Alphaproteobacteria bacterium]